MLIIFFNHIEWDHLKLISLWYQQWKWSGANWTSINEAQRNPTTSQRIVKYPSVPCVILKKTDTASQSHWSQNPDCNSGRAKNIHLQMMAWYKLSFTTYSIEMMDYTKFQQAHPKENYSQWLSASARIPIISPTNEPEQIPCMLFNPKHIHQIWKHHWRISPIIIIHAFNSPVK